MNKKFRTPKEIIAQKKLERLTKLIDEFELPDYDGKLVKFKIDLIQTRINNGEMSEKFINWFAENKEGTFTARNSRLSGTYTFDGVENWWFNEFDLEFAEEE
jgi:hypothetical protein